MNTITKEWLKANNACASGYKWFVEQDETNTAKVLLKLTAEYRFDDALWVAEHMLNKPQSVKLAIYSAELCLPNFESAYPDDDRSRKAIDAAKDYLINPCEKTKSAASAAASEAARAARAAAWAARAAASEAASAATSAAASAAANAAEWTAAWAAERAAARAAEWAAECEASGAARKETQLKIINEVIKIVGLT